MRLIKRAALVGGLLVTLLAFGAIMRETVFRRRLPLESPSRASGFSLTSPVLANNQPLPEIYSCRGSNLRPPLIISHPPKNTASLAVTLVDPDAVSGPYIHWLVWNLPADTTRLGESGLPPGAIEGQNSGARPGYSGPCPPVGTGVHRYVFTVYALSAPLAVPATADWPQVQAAIKARQIGQTQLTVSLSGR